MRYEDIIPFYQKLNYKCPKDKYGEGFSCGKNKEEAKKNFETEQKLKAEKQKGVDERRGKRAEKVSSKAEKRIAKIKDPILLENVKDVRSLIDKAKSELASGKVSKETYKELRLAVDKLKTTKSNNIKDSNNIPRDELDATTSNMVKAANDTSPENELLANMARDALRKKGLDINGKKIQPNSKVEKFKNLKIQYNEISQKVNDRKKLDTLGSELMEIKTSAKEKYKNKSFDNSVSSMASGETWNSESIGDIYIDSVSKNDITITSNGLTETYKKEELSKILKDAGKISKSYDAEDTKLINNKQKEISLAYSEMQNNREELSNIKEEIINTAYDAHVVSSEKKDYIINGKNKIKATIHEFDDGVVIYSPDNPKNQVYDVKEVYGILSLMPDTLRSNVSRINIVDGKSKDDEYWSNKLNVNFKSAGSAGDDNINLYSSSSEKKKLTTQLIAHESGHTDDNVGWDYYSDGTEWNSAMKNDKKGFITDYAKLHKSNHEDYADSVEMFINQPDLMKVSYPNRYDILDKHYNSGLPLNRDKPSSMQARINADKKSRKSK